MVLRIIDPTNSSPPRGTVINLNSNLIIPHCAKGVKNLVYFKIFYFSTKIKKLPRLKELEKIY